MKIAVVGCGALGSFYGAKLHRAGHQVHFLLRSDFEAVSSHGVQIISPEGDFRAYPICALSPEEIGICDLVLIGLKTTANAEFPRLLPPLVGPATAVLTLQNGLGNEEHIARLFGNERTMGGLCFVCLNRTSPGVIEHFAHGAVVIGEYKRRAQSRTHGIARIFNEASIPCSATENLEQAHWEKLVWNIPFNGLGVAGTVGYDAVVSGIIPVNLEPGPCLTTDQLLGESRWETLVRELMLETIHTAQGLGLDVPESAAEFQISRTRSMGPYKASTLIDFERGQRIELASLFLNPLSMARDAGAPAPRLAKMCSVLQQLDQDQRQR